MRATKQKDKFGCGPVSIYNALVAHGRKPDLKKLYKECDAKPKVGTFTLRYLEVIKSYGFKIRKVSAHSMTDEGEYFVLITVQHNKKKWGHFVYIKDGVVFNLSHDKSDKMPIRTKLNDWRIRAIVTHSPPGGWHARAWKVNGLQKVGK